ncbi:MAG TPA: hypothetical protein VL993_12485 [Stellaceae bacterium]|nr:hypothetical protein [Stellaceae bacterium]
MQRRIGRIIPGLAACLMGAILVLAAASAARAQAAAPDAKAPVVISQADIDALRALLQGSSARTADYLNSLNGAVIRPDGTVQHSAPTSAAAQPGLGAKMATAFGGLVSDHGTYASFVDAANTRISSAEAAPAPRGR